jgi:4-hydroxy-tetrahydrodipicolinate reductase
MSDDVAHSSRVRVAVSGAGGRMGSVSCQAVADDAELSLVAAVDLAFASKDLSDRGSVPRFASLAEAIEATDIDAVLDFTTPAVVRENVLTCIRLRVPVVVGTTGLSVGDLAEIERAVAEYDTPVLVAPNFAMGAVFMMKFARQAAERFGACEIVELHHDKKLDAPSGTSRLTRVGIEETWRERGLDKEVPIHSVRLPGLVAHQEVIFGGLGETLTIRHDSLSRDSFMPGVVLALKRVGGLQGLVVGLENIL